MRFTDKGMHLKRLVKGGAADRAGLKNGDVIKSINGVGLQGSTLAAYKAAIGGGDVERTYSVTIARPVIRLSWPEGRAGRLGIKRAETPGGVIVESVRDSSLAATAGLCVGDVITKVNGTPSGSEEDSEEDKFSDALSSARSSGGGDVVFELARASAWDGPLDTEAEEAEGVNDGAAETTEDQGLEYGEDCLFDANPGEELGIQWDKCEFTGRGMVVQSTVKKDTPAHRLIRAGDCFVSLNGHRYVACLQLFAFFCLPLD